MLIADLWVRFWGQLDGVQTVRDAHLTGGLALIERVNEMFEDFAIQLGLVDGVRRTIKLVLDEMLSNTLTHGFDDEREHELEVRIEVSETRIEVTLIDDGVPFDPFGHATPDTGLPVEEREIGGLGIHLVRGVMDEVSYLRENDRNVIVLSKDLEASN
jgi:anti-sigma regulatory factor (Ser/Thr protein kinase)